MFQVVSVTPHGGFRTLNLYLTAAECEAYGIERPTRDQLRLEVVS